MSPLPVVKTIDCKGDRGLMSSLGDFQVMTMDKSIDSGPYHGPRTLQSSTTSGKFLQFFLGLVFEVLQYHSLGINSSNVDQTRWNGVKGLQTYH